MALSEPNYLPNTMIFGIKVSTKESGGGRDTNIQSITIM